MRTVWLDFAEDFAQEAARESEEEEAAMLSTRRGSIRISVASAPAAGEENLGAGGRIVRGT